MLSSKSIKLITFFLTLLQKSFSAIHLVVKTESVKILLALLNACVQMVFLVKITAQVYRTMYYFKTIQRVL